MSDIVDRLRNPMMMTEAINSFGDTKAVLDPAQTKADMAAAAELIEQLRATIAQLRAIAGAISTESMTFADIKKEARHGQ